MRFHFTKTLQYYYFFILIITLGLFSYGVKYFWFDGSFNSEAIRTSYEASLHYEELKDLKKIKEIRELASSDRAREGIISLKAIEKRLMTLNQLSSLDSYEELEKEVVNSKNALNKLISYPMMSNVLLVLSNKISSFESFAVNNRWKTLSRIAKRSKGRLSSAALQTQNFYTEKNLEKLYQEIDQDKNSIESVTKSSVLSAFDKSSILAKVRTFETELKMMKDYANELHHFKTTHQKMLGKFQYWLDEIAPEITLKSLNRERDTKGIAIGVFALMTFLFISIFLGIIIARYFEKRSNKRVESEIISCIQDGIFPIEEEWSLEGYSEDFKQEFLRLREYFHKRISFGTVFQEAVPFSSVLLDSNLNLSWANDLFYEHWNLADTHRNGAPISWDYLQQYTNLGEDDPVLLAYKQKVAGIYQIQVRDPKTEDVAPFEMYVSPVEYSGQSRVMIFFYPLRSLEETMTNQARAIVGPVKRTLDSFVKNTFSGNEKEKLEKDFEIAGIGELFSKFCQYRNIISEVEKEYLEEISIQENNLHDQAKLINELEERAEIGQRKIQEFQKNIRMTKRFVVKQIEIRSKVEELLHQSGELLNEFVEKEKSNLIIINKLNESLNESNKSLDIVLKAKQQMNLLRSRTDDVKSNIGLLQSSKSGANSVIVLESFIKDFNLVCRSLDVGLSKMELMAEGREQQEVSANRISSSFVKELSKLAIDAHEYANNHDEQIVEELKSLFDNFLVLKENIAESLKALEEFKNEEDQKAIHFMATSSADQMI